MNYESSLKAQRDHFSSMNYAEKRGMEKGIEKGRVEGKIEEIKNLILKLGLSDKEVASIAGVSVAFVKKIRKEIGKG